MASQPLRIVVTGLTNAGKSTLINAILDRNILPAAPQSETSVITYVMPQLDTSALPHMLASCRNDQGNLVRHSSTTGTAEIHAQIGELNRVAREDAPTQVGGPHQSMMIECRVESPIRESLSSAVWSGVQLLDIGGPDDELNNAVQQCADIAYSLCHQVVVCVKHDQTRSSAMKGFLQDLQCKAPHLFQEASDSGYPSVVFVITQLDQIRDWLYDDLKDDRTGIIRNNLRKLLLQTLGANSSVAQCPIIMLSGKNVLATGRSAFLCELYEWHDFEQFLLNSVSTRSRILHDCQLTRGGNIHSMLKSNWGLIGEGQWPHHSADLWTSRWNFRKKVAIGVAVTTGAVGTGVAAGVYIAASTAAASAASSASAAVAASNTWYAWLFGFGTYGAAASKAAATASAASGAAYSSGWCLAACGAATFSIGVAGSKALGSTSIIPDGVAFIAGTAVMHASAVGAARADDRLRRLQFSGTAASINAGEEYCDVLFYPINKDWCDACTRKCGTVQNLACLSFPFRLFNVVYQKNLYFDGSSMGCCGEDCLSQLWWAVPGNPGTVLQSYLHGGSVRADKGRNYFDKRCSVSCIGEQGEEQSWLIVPGDTPGTIRLKNIEHCQYLYCEGMFGTGTCSEKYPDQEWLVIPMVPFYIGDFQSDLPCGEGEMFWPNGSPAFKGRFVGGVMQRGFLFDERAICHGHFRFDGDAPEIDGFQLEDWDESSICIICMDSPAMIVNGTTLSCGHGVTCKVCAEILQECPFCRQTVAIL